MKKSALLLFLLAVVSYSGWAQVTAHRYLFLEHFTNTRCSLCPNRNGILQTTLTDNPGQVHRISYHPSVPYSSCLIYQSNTAENGARQSQYGVNFTPQARLWGSNHMTSTVLLSPTTLADSSGQDALLRVSVEEQTSPARGVSVRVKTMEQIPTGDIRIFAAVVEKIYPYAAPNGEQEHHDVFRTMLPDIDGETFTPAGIGEELAFNYAYSLDPSWNPSEIYILAWVQDMNTNVVYNSGKQADLNASISEVNGTATVTAQGGIAPYAYLWSNGNTTNTVSGLPGGTHTVKVSDSAGAYFMESVTVESSVSIAPELLQKLLTIYPNPTRDQLFVDLNGIDFVSAKLSLHDLSGRQVVPAISVRSGQSEARFELAHLTKGIYSLQIEVDGSRVQKKITVL